MHRGLGWKKRDHPLYSCTPIGAKIFGWDNCIHYCFIDGFDEMVFVVNPENFGGPYVYPLARNFSDFLGMLLTYKTTNALHQIIIFEKERFMQFLNSPNEQEYISQPKVVETLAAIQKELNIVPMEDPYDYVMQLQKEFVRNFCIQEKLCRNRICIIRK
mgnify:CR=1 FL=1